MATEINELRIVAKTESLARAESDLNKVAAAQEKVSATGQTMATVTDLASKKQISAASAWDRMRRSVDEQYRALQAVEKAQRDAARAVEQGVTSAEDAAAVVALVAAKYGLAAGEAATLAAETERLGAAQAALEARTAAYLAAIDPVYSAQKRFNGAVLEAEDLYTSGAISLAQYEAGLAKARSAMDAATASVRKLAEAQAKAAQDSFNAALGVRDDFDTAKRAADIEAFAREYEKYTRGLLDARNAELALSAARAQAAQSAINERLGVRDDFGTASRAADIEAYARAYDAYVAKLLEARQAEEALARARAQTAQAGINARLGVKDDFGSQQRAADIAAVGQEIDRLRGKYVPLYAMQRQYKAELLEINEAARLGVLTETERAAAIQRTKDAFARQVRSDPFSAAARGAKLTAYEMTNLSYQLNDVATSLASGASPFMVMAQQGGQVYQVLAGSQGGVAGSIRQIGAGLLGLITPARLVTAGVAGIAVAAALAYASYSAGERQLANSLQGLGKSTEATVAQLETISAAAASASNISVSSARTLTASFAGTGKIGKEVFTGLIDVTSRYATLTSADLADAGKEMAQAFAAPSKGAVDLNQKLNFLDVATLKYIQDLEYSGQKTAAQQALQSALNKSLPLATENVTKLGWAWRSVANFALGAYDAMGKAVSSALKGPSLDQQIAALEKQVAAERAAAAGPKGRTQGVAAANLIRDEAALNKLYAERAQHAKDVADADARSASMAAQQVAEGRDPRFEHLRQLREQQALLNKATDNGTKGTQEQRDALEGVKNEIAALSANGTTLISVQEKLRRERELELAVIRAQTPTAKIEAQAALDAYRAKAAGATSAVAAAEAENTKIKALAEVYAQLSQSARQRLEAADEAISQQGLEAQLIGKTAGETALLRANYQTYWDLRREAAQAGTGFDQAEYDRLKKKNEELARSTQLTAELKLQDEIAFQRAQLGRSSQDQAIASTLRSSGVAVDLNSADAAALRLNATLSDMSTTADSALSGFIQDLRSGKSLTDALTNAMNKLLDKLIEMASNQAISSLMSGLFGISGLGGGGSLGTVGTTTGAVYVAGAHSGGVLGAGEATFTRADHPALYADAPRFHSGRDPYRLLAGEQRVIVKEEEGIFTPAQMRALGARMGGGDTVAPVFAPVINMGAAGQGGGGISPQDLEQTLMQWWKNQRADVVNVIRDARSRRVPGV